MVAINKVPMCLEYIVKNKIPLSFDVSDNYIPEFGSETIISDMRRISESSGEGRWFGGEFIAGVPEFFSQLVWEIDSVFPGYIQELNVLHHIGDEIVVSVALERFEEKVSIPLMVEH